MTYHWEYANTLWLKLGRMICTECQHPIVQGDFRYRETDDAYLPQHRDCCADDTMWREIDNERITEHARLSQYLSDCIAFREKWNIDTLDDEITATQDAIERYWIFS